MNVDNIRQPMRQVPAMPGPAALDSCLDETGVWSSGMALRLLVTPALVTVLLAGGVYWIRLQPPAGLVGQQTSSIMQVHLLPRPSPIPITVASVPHSSPENLAGRLEALKETDPAMPDAPVAVPMAKISSPTDLPPSSVMSTPSAVTGPASSAVVRFQQTLLRHVARYQRYPSAARSLHLEGRVDMQFAISRDGTLLGVWVKTSSGQGVLDKEAIETIRRSQPLPSIPSELPDRLNIHVQLAFDPT